MSRALYLYCRYGYRFVAAVTRDPVIKLCIVVALLLAFFVALKTMGEG